MWPLRVYTRKKQACQRLNLTPTPDLSVPAKMEAPPGPDRGLVAHRKPRGPGLWGGIWGGWALAQEPQIPRVELQDCSPETCRLLAGLKGKRKARGLPKVMEKEEHSGPGESGCGSLSIQLRVTGEEHLKANSSSEESQEENAPLSESVTDCLQADSSSSNSELISGLSFQHDSSSSLLSHSITDSYTECNSFEESLSSFPSPELFRGPGYLDLEHLKLEDHMQYRNSTLLDSSKAVAIEKAPQFSNLSAILGASSEDYQKCHKRTVVALADQNLFSESKSTSNLETANASCEVLLAEKTCPPAPEKTKKKKTNSTVPDKKSRGLLTSTPSSQTSSFAIPSNTPEMCCIIRASPGTRKAKIKAVTVKKKYSPCKDIPQVGIMLVKEKKVGGNEPLEEYNRDV
ncbi:PREDICTED: uncharacterized protein DDB_G0271670-like [Chrysochloris asiatica]|uniref:Uncharacterized protein DDB_G0271670-like n=1 Tax=Chrysochloris asiatica TaxID=185453 RepID=A0A9B0U3V5_CHRAS|nr:PREDICTED: uncharacterized protein DDB_G0271670-like [Chrysochloris asiatica]